MIIIRTQKEISNYINVTPEYLLKIKTWKRNLSQKKQELLKEFYRTKLLELNDIIDG